MKVSSEWSMLSQLLGELGTPEFRWLWWQQLVQDQPKVAQRLIRDYPHVYPVRDPDRVA